jgi:hypothetical protein
LSGISSRRLPVDPQRFVREEGDNPAVVCIHDMIGGTSFPYRKVLAELAGHGRRGAKALTHQTIWRQYCKSYQKLMTLQWLIKLTTAITIKYEIECSSATPWNSRSHC